MYLNKHIIANSIVSCNHKNLTVVTVQNSKQKREETINKSFTQQKGGVYLFKNLNGKKENVMDVEHLARNVGKVLVVCNLTQ